MKYSLKLENNMIWLYGNQNNYLLTYLACVCQMPSISTSQGLEFTLLGKDKYNQKDL